MAISHEQGVIHRDLKPDNIFLSNIDGKQDFVKILDYGLAKPLDPREPALTDMGKVVGTPEYMSPEQCRGPTPEERKYGISHVDARADIYSLGIVLYQCLSGRVPFSLEGEPTPQNFLRLMSRQISEEPRPLHRFRNDIPEALIDVINTALKKNPTERYSSMPEMQQALIKAIPDFDNSLQYTNNKGFKQIILLSKLKHQRPMFSNFSFKIQLDPELEY
jgi:serine/threonine-protein kinase